MRKGLSRRELDGLIRRLGTRRGPAVPEAARPGIPQRREGGPCPLSFAQRRLWLLDQLEPGSSAYNVPGALRLRGPLDPAALARALREIVRRHEALRTRFVAGDGEALQEVRPAPPRFLTLVDLGGARAAAPEVLRREARRPFDLERGPLLRAVLLRLEDDDHWLSLTLHHVVSDGWSLGVLLRELCALYEAFAAGEPSPLPELPLQYPDFAVWQRRSLAGDQLERHLAYWRRQLRGVPALELPVDRPRTASRRRHGGTVERPLAPRATLARLGRGPDATLFMVLVAAFQALLRRWTGQHDFAVGAPIAGRTRPELEGLIGFFVNTLALRAPLPGDPSFRDLLARVREVTLAAYEHQEAPFEKLVEELHPERQGALTPFFQVVLALDEPFAPRRLGALEAAARPLPNGAAKFDLTLTLTPAAEGLHGALEYDRGLFDRTTARRFLDHLASLVHAVAADPGSRLSRLPLASAAERHQLAIEWNEKGRAAGLPERPLHAIFARRAAARPDAAALLAGERVVSYGELDRRSDHLARRLIERGVGAGARVALGVERSPEMIVATLAVLKAGGAYVPLDPSFPRERLELMLDDAGVAVLLCSRALAPRLAGLRAEGVRRLELEELPAGGAAPPRVEVDPGALAYVMYTSGSTGRPKGVAVTHRNVARLVRATDFMGFGRGQVFLQNAPASFDAATLEIWGPLANGGVLALAPAGQSSLEELAATLERHRVTTLWLTAGLFHQLVEERPETVAGLGQLLAGGEALSPPHVRRALAALAGGRLINGYGPTEGTTFTCTWTVEAARLPAGSVPIGRPIAHTTVYLADRWLRPVPMGVPGQLVTGGAGVARGYLGRPRLTAAAFVPDPWSPAAGGRLYQTGDLARHLPDGRVDFLGRLDRQVKLRGFRIELGEIEAVLAALPGVGRAVAVVRDDAPGGARALAAYVTVAGDFDPEALRAAVAERVPDYMVPAAFVALPELPLGATGKVDHRALPAPRWRDAGARRVAPRTAAEELVAGIWAEVLATGEPVGVDDDFFALGGHSLLATRVISRLRRAFDVELPLASLFENPTVAALAAAIERQGAAAAQESVPGPVPRARGGRVAVSFAQERLWFIDRLEPGRATYNIPAAVRLRGDLDAAALAAAWAAVARRHEALRTTFAETDGRPWQVIHEELAPPFALADLGGLPAARRAGRARAILDAGARRPFDLASGPLLRGILLRLSAREHVLFVNLHHVVADGWSVDVLVRELAALYGAVAAGRPAPLPPLPVQYADYALWQREWLRGEVLERQLAHWRGRLAGVPVLELPADRPRPARPRHRGATFPAAVPEPLTESLAALSRRQGATLFMTLLAAFGVVLARTAGGQRDLAVGAPIANRRRRAVEDLIGLFVNTVVLRLDLRGRGLPFRELLGRARRAVLEADRFQDLPFEKVVEAAGGERDLAVSPLFQAMLILQGTPLRLELPGLDSEPVAVDTGTAKFDLTLALTPSGGGLSGYLEFDRDLFERAAMERLWRRFLLLLEGAAADPETSVWELPFLSAAERRQVLDEWNLTASGRPCGPTLHGLFERQAARTPEAVAVRRGGRLWSYRELDARAERLAARLEALGAGGEDVVGLCLERGLELVAAMLAVLKAGAAYVPLDPSYPEERLAFMIADARSPVVVTREALRGAVPRGAHELLVLDGDAAAARPAAAAVAPAGLAYLIYTSGSTGRPKGVAMTHDGAAALALWAGEVFADVLRRGVLAATSINFDLSVFEIFAPLARGGTVIVAADALELPRLAERDAVALVNTVPSAMAELVAAGGVPPGVRTVNLAGEPLRRALADRIYAETAADEVWNLYGPSEDTTYSTAARVPRQGTDEPSIGRPVADTRAYVTDRDGRPVPPGVVGELRLAGRGLARGYLRRPALTAERFVPDPFAVGPGGRLYRTGDLARHRGDGELLFLGRVDHQVKVRGFRIELGEIEAALLDHPAVAEAVATALPGPASADDRRLVAYVGGAAVAPGGEELRAHLERRLPDYMVPAAIVALARLPRLPNGKVDRKALPHPRWGGGEYVAPATWLEKRLAEIWASLLGVERVGADDHFFALGGHSLLATRVVSRVREAFALEMPVRWIFEAPTVRALAARLESAPAAEDAARPARRVAGRTYRPAPAQERLWFLDRLDPAEAAYNLPLALRLGGRLDTAAFRAAVEGVVRRHETLRARFRGVDGAPIVEISEPAPVAVPVIDLAALGDDGRERESRRLLRALARRPFDLRRGPLARFTLLRLGGREHVAAVVLHHVVADGWSLGVLLRELRALYGHCAGGGRPLADPAELLGELPIRYADFARQQHDGRPGEGERHLEYWRRQLRGVPVLELPTDRPRPAVASLAGAAHGFEIPPAPVRALEELARGEDATLFMVLLAAFAVLLSRYADQRDLAIGTPVANRRSTEVEGLVGLFVNTLVLRLDLGGDVSFRGLVRRARQVALAADEHQDAPFEKVVEAVAPERHLDASPLFQVMLVFQTAPLGDLELPGLALETLPIDAGTSKFDLTLSLEPRRDGLRGVVEYRRDLFAAATIERFAAHFVTILERAAGDPEQRTSAIAMLAEAERERLARWARPENGHRRYVPVSARFAERAARMPEKVAVVAGEESWTFAELGRRSGRLARLLTELAR